MGVHPRCPQQRSLVAGADRCPADDRVVVPVGGRLLSRASAYRRRCPAGASSAILPNECWVGSSSSACSPPILSPGRGASSGRRRPGTRDIAELPIVTAGMAYLPSGRRRTDRAVCYRAFPARRIFSASPTRNGQSPVHRIEHDPKTPAERPPGAPVPEKDQASTKAQSRMMMRREIIPL